jgi:hypothetical protein
MKLKTKVFNSISRFAAVMIVLCILPSGAFASENKPAFTHVENITDENFSDVQAEMLDSISEQIADLQSFYTNVSEASDASELQEVLSSRMPANEPEHDGMNMGPGGMPGLFGFAQVENVTDDNYTDVQAELVGTIGNMTDMLNSQLDNTTDDNRTEMLTEQINGLETLSSEISEASSADELQDAVFTYVQTQTVDSLEMEIDHLEAMESNSENTSDENMSENLSSRITELTSLIEEINGAESLEDLMEIMSSSQSQRLSGQGNPGMDVGGPMQHGGCDCPMGPGKMPENNAENGTEA